MKKEYAIVTTLGFFLLAYLLDYFAGPVAIPIKSPFLFLQNIYLTEFPFTAVAIGLRSMAIVASLVILFSALGIKDLVKALIIFILAILFNLYAIQQLATGARVTPIQWTLSFAFAGVMAIVPIVIFLLKGIVTSLHQSLTGSPPTQLPPGN